MNDKWLDKEEFVSYAPELSRSQISVNHLGCQAGVDTKKRLRIKKHVNGVIVAFCHHCRKRGVHFPTKYAPNFAGVISKSPTSSQLDANPVINVVNQSTMLKRLLAPQPRSLLGLADLELREFLSRKYLEPVDVLFFRYLSIKAPLSIGLPIFGSTIGAHNACLGINMRIDTPGMKYQTTSFLGDGQSLRDTIPYIYGRERTLPPPMDSGHVINRSHSSTLWLVEDYALALRLAYLGEMAVPLYGTTMSTYQLVELAKLSNADLCIVWLDNDNPTVIKDARNLGVRAKCVFPGVLVRTEVMPDTVTPGYLAGVQKTVQITFKNLPAAIND